MYNISTYKINLYIYKKKKTLNYYCFNSHTRQLKNKLITVYISVFKNISMTIEKNVLT